MQNKIENLEKEVASLKQRNLSHENNTERMCYLVKVLVRIHQVQMQ